jgi:hypothetical protein
MAVCLGFVEGNTSGVEITTRQLRVEFGIGKLYFKLTGQLGSVFPSSQ